MLVALGSRNPLKIMAAEYGARFAGPKFEVEPTGAFFGKPDRTDSAKVLELAQSRAMHALDLQPRAHLGLAIEPVYIQVGDLCVNAALTVVVNRSLITSKVMAQGVILNEIDSDRAMRDQELDRAVGDYAYAENPVNLLLDDRDAEAAYDAEAAILGRSVKEALRPFANSVNGYLPDTEKIVENLDTYLAEKAAQ